MPEEIKQHIDKSGILILRLDRPDKLNALNETVLLHLSQGLLWAKENPKVKALIIIGSGKAFCAGADISRLAQCNGFSGYDFASQGQAVFRQLESLGKPSVAAINGMALGGGCELSMAATFRIASTEAIFGQPEVGLGVIPGYGGTQRLARLIGKGRALDLCLTGRSISAQTALEWGLITALVPAEALLKEACLLLEKVLEKSPLAVAAVMEVIDQGYDLPLDQALHLEALHFARLCAAADKEEGMAAFLEKRKPKF